MPRQQPKPGKTTGVSARATEQRAQWTVERWAQRMTLTNRGMLAEVRATFACGKTAAEQAVKRAKEIMREQWTDPKRDDELRAMLARKYIDIAETAERRGELRAARAALDSLARLRGLAAPVKIEHSAEDELLKKLGDVSDEKLAAMLADMGVSVTEEG